MIDYEVLKQFGTSNEQLRTVFSEWDGRKREGRPHAKLRKLINARIQEGLDWSLRNAHHYTAADLLWDGAPILPANIPLIQYAQGKLNQESCIKQLEGLGCATQFIRNEETKTNGRTETVRRLDAVRFVETCVQIGRSYISRRLFAQTNKYNGQTPFLPYESRFSTQTGRLRAALMSQYAQIMADNYGYAHLQTQWTRHMLLYGHAVVFPDCAWHDDRQTVRATRQGKDDTGRWPVRTRIVREGVPFTPRHPSRVFYDRAYPLASLNTDTGCTWVGFWDVWRYGDVLDNAEFFNREKVRYSEQFKTLHSTHSAYFQMYYGDQPVVIVPPKAASSLGLAEKNERAAMSTFYAADDRDASVMLTDMRLKLVPRDWGLGDYPHPVWLRLLVASDETVVFAEWLPSRPCFVASFNENDDRMLNQGQAHEIMPVQDQVSNILSQLLLTMKYSLLRIVAINKDLIPQDVQEAIKKDLSGQNYFEKPHLMFFSFSKLEEMGIKVSSAEKAIINIAQPQAAEDYINNAFRAIGLLLSILEKLLMLSPQEQGQPAPREITATESAMLEATTSAVYSAISDAIDEARGAMRVILYESAMARASNEIFLPVSQTFAARTIEAAGLRVVHEEGQEEEAAASRRHTWTVTGTKDALEHHYIFTGRDTGDRPTNTQTAQTMITLLAQLLPIVGPESLGKERIFEMINEVARLLGVNSLKLELAEDESNQLAAEDRVRTMMEQFMPQIQQMAATSEEHGSAIEQIAQQLEKITQSMGTLSQMVAGAAGPQPAALTAAGGAPTPIVGSRAV